MSLLFIEGFDNLNEIYWDDAYQGMKWDLTDYGSDFYVLDTGWLGSGYAAKFLDANSYSGGYSRSIPDSNTIIIGMALKYSYYPIIACDYAAKLFRLRRGSENQLYVQQVSTGHLQVVRGDGTVLGTTTNVIPSGMWFYLELKATITSSGGSFELRIDGATECSGSGLDTASLGTDGVNTIAIAVHGSGVFHWWYDDIYCCNSSGSVNNDFLGGNKVHLVAADGEGYSEQWTRSTGTHNYECIRETVADTASYVSSYTDSQIDSYTFANLSYTPSAIRGVQLAAFAKRSSVQDRNFLMFARVNSTNYEGDQQALAYDWKCPTQMVETNPNTGTVWTKATLDGAEFGIKVT